MLVLAAALRLWKIQDVTGNVFYDAAVRSMGTSWHDFFFGALEPSGTVSIDKPPVDLWLQVAATRVLGFHLVGLHLPEALGGVAACGLLFGALRRPFGFAAALAGALALAVLPVSVLTARSDTMDSVLAAVEVAALWCSWRALESGRMRWSVLSAAVMGVAFNVKLAEMLIALPALALLWAWAAPGRRVRVALATAGTFLLVALSWTAIAALTPTGQRPFPIGSANGSIWHVTLVYDGLARLSGHGATGTSAGGAGPLRLLSAGPAQYRSLIGVALLATSLLALLALATLLARGFEHLRTVLSSPRGRFSVGIAIWFLTGLLAFSAMQRLQVRYLEAFAPAVCAVLGCSLSVLWRGAVDARRHSGATGRRGALVVGIGLVGVGLALLVASLSKDAYLIRRARTDSLLSDFSTPALSRYLRAHHDGTHYEVAGANINDILGLVARDDLPVLVLNSVDGSLTRTKTLQAQVAERRVRFYFVASHPCHRGRHCPNNQIWAYAHSTPVPGQPGLRRFTAG